MHDHARQPAMHPCPVPGCTAGAQPYTILMCVRHWRMVPKPLQRAVYDHWRRGHPTAEYPEVRQEAIRVAEEEELRLYLP